MTAESSAVLCGCGHRKTAHDLLGCSRIECDCLRPISVSGQESEPLQPVEPKPLQTTTTRKTCKCGHREAVHEMNGDETCRIVTCACVRYTEIPRLNTDAQVKQRRADRGHGGSRTDAEPGAWRALVEDLSTGAVYLVARGSKTFVSRTLTAYVDVNPLPQTKRGVLSMDHEYVKAPDDAPFFNDEESVQS